MRMRKMLKGLMVYPEDTAGSIMTTEFVALNQHVTAEEAINILRAEAPSAETVYYVYVVDDDEVWWAFCPSGI